MRVESWDWANADRMVIEGSLDRVRMAANTLATAVQAACPKGTISRPMYQTGPYKDQVWTSRDAGRLKDSVRVVERYDQQHGFTLAQFKSIGNYGNIRVYVGHYTAWYAQIVEYFKPFLRPTTSRMLPVIKRILETGEGGLSDFSPSKTASGVIKSPTRARQTGPRVTKSGLPHLLDSPEWKAYIARGSKPKW